jgi:hypothetical protein
MQDRNVQVTRSSCGFDPRVRRAASVGGSSGPLQCPVSSPGREERRGYVGAVQKVGTLRTCRSRPSSLNRTDKVGTTAMHRAFRLCGPAHYSIGILAPCSGIRLKKNPDRLTNIAEDTRARFGGVGPEAARLIDPGVRARAPVGLLPSSIQLQFCAGGFAAASLPIATDSVPFGDLVADRA